jgi:hypothetical protein
MELKQIRMQRLRELQSELGADGPVELGKAIGRKANQTSDLLSGRASFGEKVARSIEQHAGLPSGWLDEADLEATPLRFSKLPAAWLAVLPLGADPATPFNPHETALSGSLNLSREWMRALGLEDPEALRYLHISDDLMEPTLMRADVLLVDTSVRDSRRDGIHVLHVGDRLLVRRLRLRLDRNIEVSADSSTVKSTDVAEPTDLRVLGRAVWVWRGRKL